LLPFAGRIPDVFIGLPLNVIFAIAFFPKLIKLLSSRMDIRQELILDKYQQ
jgi:hypothetical protein